MRYFVNAPFKRVLMLLCLTAILAAPTMAAAPFFVYPNGTRTFTVPAGQFLNVFGRTGSGSTKVFKQVGGPSNNMVAQFTLETSGVVTNGETSFGAYTNATVIRIEAGIDGAIYSIGALAAAIPVLQALARPAYTQFTPIAYTTTQLLLATDLMTGIITGTHAAGATQAYTLPTGTLMDAACGLQINQGFEWTLINLSGTGATNTITLTAGSGHTIVGDAVLQGAGLATGCNAARWFTRKTAANTFVTLRIQ